MKSFVVLALFVAAAAAAPASPPNAEAAAQIISQNSDITENGYKSEYQTSNGISATEEGQVVNAGAENESIAVRGQYSYTGPDGVVYTIVYLADENGFQPKGAHIPTDA